MPSERTLPVWLNEKGVLPANYHWTYLIRNNRVARKSKLTIPSSIFDRRFSKTSRLEVRVEFCSTEQIFTWEKLLFVFGTRRCFQKTKNWIRLFLYILGLRAVCDTTPPNLLDTASASVRRQQPIKCTAARRSLPSLWRSFGMLGARSFAHTTEKDVFSWTAIGLYWGQKKRRKIEYGLDLGLIQ